MPAVSEQLSVGGQDDSGGDGGKIDNRIWRFPYNLKIRIFQPGVNPKKWGSPIMKAAPCNRSCQIPKSILRITLDTTDTLEH